MRGSGRTGTAATEGAKGGAAAAEMICKEAAVAGGGGCSRAGATGSGRASSGGGIKAVELEVELRGPRRAVGAEGADAAAAGAPIGSGAGAAATAGGEGATMTREGVEASGAASGSMKGAEAGAEATASAEGASGAEAAAVAVSTHGSLVILAAMAPWMGHAPSPSASCCLQLHALIGLSLVWRREGKRERKGPAAAAAGAELREVEQRS